MYVSFSAIFQPTPLDYSWQRAYTSAVDKLSKKPIIGILGGIGSGKNTVTDEFVKLGCKAIDADRIVHELFEQEPIKKQIAASFGDGILDFAGKIDRRKLADIVFSDGNKLSLLNSIIHPLVLRKILASSSFAIAMTLNTLIERLENKSKAMGGGQDLTETLGQEFETVTELAEEWSGDEEQEQPAGQSGGLTEEQEKAILLKGRFLIKKFIFLIESSILFRILSFSGAGWRKLQAQF